VTWLYSACALFAFLLTLSAGDQSIQSGKRVSLLSVFQLFFASGCFAIRALPWIENGHRQPTHVSVGAGRRHPVLLFLVAFLGMIFMQCFPMAVQAQVDWSASDQTSTPQPGSGHDYLHLLGETVNPATGSVSVRINLPLPQQRGSVNIPFSIGYDSNGLAAPVQASGTVDGVGGVPSGVVGSTSGQGPCSQNSGWSYSFPCLSARHTNINFNVTTAPGNGSPETCDWVDGYTFYAPSSDSHPLNMILAQTDSDPQHLCPAYSSTSVSGVSNDQSYYQATATSNVAGLGTESASVVDTDGTVYSFPSFTDFTMTSTSTGYVTIYATLPSFIEDRNGNKATISQTASQTTITDTLGRPVLSLSPGPTLYTNSVTSSTDTFSVSGSTNPYKVNWVVSSAAGVGNGGYTLHTTVAPGVPASAEGTCVAADHFVEFPPGNFVQSIDLPNGQQYGFTYHPTYGTLQSITYPSGLTVKYDWNVIPNLMQSDFYYAQLVSGGVGGPGGGPLVGAISCPYYYDAVAITGRHVIENGVEVQTQTFQYTPATSFGGSTTTTMTTTDDVRKTSTVTAIAYIKAFTRPNMFIQPQQDSQNLFYESIGLQVPGFLSEEKSETATDSNGALLETVAKTWNQDGLLQNVTTTLGTSGPTSEVAYSYLGSSGLVTEKDEYDYGATSPTRKTVTNYQSFSPTPIYKSALSIIDHPASTITYNASGSAVAETDYSYDQTAIVPVFATQHDESNYASTSEDPGNYQENGAVPRGNATTVTRKCYVGSTACTNAVTTYTYDETGQVASETDPCGNASCSDMAGTSHTTTYSFNDNPGTGNPAGFSNAYLTKITAPVINGVAHTQSYQYNYATGELSQSTDENSQTTNYTYNDLLLRPTLIQGPPDPNNGGKRPATQYVYNDSASCSSGTGTCPTVTKTVTVNAAGAQTMTTTVMDEQGHAIETQFNSDPSGTDYVDTVYDGMGQHYTASNPYRSSTDPTYGLMTYTYDALGRPKSQVEQDGLSTLSWTYSGNVSTAADENGNAWQKTTNALGQLIQVLELGSTSSPLHQETDYTYDVLGNLLTVNQVGTGSETPRTRSFTYDSLSRLLTSTNSETGTICYGQGDGTLAGCQANGYDANGNLFYKTDARGLTTSYGYDGLNRLIRKTVPLISSSGAVAGQYQSTCYEYDTISGSLASANLIGHLAVEWTQSGNSCASPYTPSLALTAKIISTYDAMGRPLTSQQCVKATCQNTPFTQSQTYDLAGNMTSWTDGRGLMTFGEQFDPAERPVSVTNSVYGNGLPSVLFSAQGYTPAGALQNWNVGGDLNFVRGYDSRLSQ